MLDWYASGLDELLGTLPATDPAIHRVDAELGHDIVREIDPPLAADGIDEILTVMMEGLPEWASSKTSKETMRIECGDRPGTWSFRFVTWSGVGPGSGTEYRDEPSIVFEAIQTATTKLGGAASDLDLFLWGRGPKERLAITGDEALVDRLRGIAAEANQ